MDAAKFGDEMTTFVQGLAIWAAEALPNIVAALLLLALGWWLAARLARGVGRILRRTRIDPTLHTILTTTLRYAVQVLVFIAVLGQLGIQTTSILAALGAMGLAIGLAMQGTLTNIAAGIMLLWLRPFRAGDYIDADGIAGTVKDIGLFTSELQSWDGLFVFVPNGQLWNRKVVNFSRLPTRLVDLKFTIAYGDDIALGKRTLLDLATADQRSLKEPAPVVFVSALGDSAVELNLRVWVAKGDFAPLGRDLLEQGKLALEGAGLSIPFPQREVRLQPAEAPASAPAKTG